MLFNSCWINVFLALDALGSGAAGWIAGTGCGKKHKWSDGSGGSVTSLAHIGNNVRPFDQLTDILVHREVTLPRKAIDICPQLCT